MIENCLQGGDSPIFPMLHASQFAPTASEITFSIFLTLLIIIVFLILAFLGSAATRRRRWDRLRSSARRIDTSEGDETGSSRNDFRPFILGLRNPDWEARSAAALALGIYGDETAVGPLIETLMKDRNEVVRENAALSLSRIDCVRAVDPLIKIVNDFVRHPESGMKLVLTSAKILGETGNPKTVGVLKKLHECLEKKNLEQELREVSAALRKVKSAAKTVGKKCCVCNLPLGKEDKIVRCPFCGNVAHKAHMLEWLHVRGCCPVCQEQVSESALEEA